MKKVVLFLTLILLGNGYLKAQNGWTKAQRQDIYNNCLNDLSMKKHITPEQRKALCLCYLQTLTEENSADKYLNMIDIEQETVNNSAMDRCSKKLGISMAAPTKPKKEEKDVPVTKSNLVGEWKLKNEEYTLYLNPNGKFYTSTGEKGNWWVSYGKLSFSGGALSFPSKYDIVKLTNIRLIIRGRSTGTVEEYYKQD